MARLILMAVVAGLLAGCGGGSDLGPEPDRPDPGRLCAATPRPAFCS